MTAKKKAPGRAHKVPSRGLWIAPDLERKIKGEGGRRGLSDPPYSYYLHLADLVLKPSDTTSASNEPLVSKEPKPEVPPSLVEPPPLPIVGPPAPVMPVRPAGSSNSLQNEIPAPLPPLAPPLILPALRLPKPAKRIPPPKPAKRVAPKPARPRPPKSAIPKNLARVARPKTSVPKPKR